MSENLRDTIGRLRDVLADMQATLDDIDSLSQPEPGAIRGRIARWTQAIGQIVADSDAPLGHKPSLKARMAAAILERDVSADAAVFDLRDLTQIAALVRPECKMTIEHADALSAIERTAIATACPGTVAFM